MQDIVDVRFAPFNFSSIPSFPNVVPIVDEWRYFLPRFKGEDEYCPAHHLIKFHQCMYQLDIHHEDVLMKMFMYPLDADVGQWYRTLLASSISSLREFHKCFHNYCKRIYHVDCLLEHCC
jgi:hypothetical protein